MGIRLSSKRYDQIQEHANRLLIAYSGLQFPIDLINIINQIPGVELRMYSSVLEEKKLLCMISEDGFTQTKDGVHIIWINDDVNEDRQRYTIAHELGHIVLGHFCKDDLSEEIRESEANFFANRLLAPMWAIQQLSCKDEWNVSQQFGISMECAYYRVNNYRKWSLGGSVMTEIEEFMSYIFSFKHLNNQEDGYEL